MNISEVSRLIKIFIHRDSVNNLCFMCKSSVKFKVLFLREQYWRYDSRNVLGINRMKRFFVKWKSLRIPFWGLIKCLATLLARSWRFVVYFMSSCLYKYKLNIYFRSQLKSEKNINNVVRMTFQPNSKHRSQSKNFDEPDRFVSQFPLMSLTSGASHFEKAKIFKA